MRENAPIGTGPAVSGAPFSTHTSTGAQRTMTSTTADEHQVTERRAAGAVSEPRATLRQSAIGIIRADEVSVAQGLVGAVLARGDVSVSQAGARTFLAAGDMRVQQGGGGMFLAGGGAEIRQGGVGTLITAGDAIFEMGGAVLAVGRSVEARQQSTICLALAPRVVIHPGARLVAGPREAGIAGAVAGILIGLLVVAGRALIGRR